MRWWMKAAKPLTYGGITLGFLQAVERINFNAIWFDLLSTVFTIIGWMFFGGDLAEFSNALSGSSFGSFFL
jgi:hypothetical protein